MSWLKRHWRGVVRVISAILLCAGLYCGYWWCYKCAPWRRTLSPEWYTSHSQREFWQEVQEGIRRGMWSHDDGFTVGQYGDKSWAEWIMDRVTPGTSMSCLGAVLTHSASAMRCITNHDVGDDADAWLAWWNENRLKSQEEWIADGFRQRGFDISVPPLPEQTPVLLAVLGKSEVKGAKAIPEEMKYNAFRCLRDSGFEPVAFAIANRTLSAETERGLLEYVKKERRWPAACGVGVLPFGQRDTDGQRSYPALLTPRFQITANALVFGPLLLGAALLLCSFRWKRSSALTPAPRADKQAGGGDG